LSTNTARQLTDVTSSPPMIGPAAAAIPATAAHTPTARARSAASA
jgi:hypothetical protein